MNNAVTAPRKSLSAGRIKLRAMGRKFEGWSVAQRERVASQLRCIRHWKIIEGDYTLAPNDRATWFVDPPYQVAGSHYVHRRIDYAALASWCRDRSGQVIVCENAGASWLPFRVFGAMKSGPSKRVSHEMIWTQEGA
jgi:16S rRNA G966 N2-methylase RsmD